MLVGRVVPKLSKTSKIYGRIWAKAILLGEHSVVYGHPAVALPLHDLQMRATAAPVHGPSRLRCLDYCGPIDRAGPRFACIARAFEAAREFSGCLDLSCLAGLEPATKGL